METVDYHGGINAKDLSLVPNLVLPPKFKTPEFEKYNRTSCPETHVTMFCRKMIGYVNNDQLLIHYFQDSLIGSAAKWYNQLSHAQIGSWKDLAQTFMKQYGHVTDIAPDRITLQNMEKKPNESFRQYAQRWREMAMQVQPPLLGKETTMLFINTLKAPFINHMLGSTAKSFSDIVMSGEMIENAVRCGKIEAGESAKRSALRRKENEMNNASIYNKGYSKPVTVSQPRAVTASHQGSARQDSNPRPNTERVQFTPIIMMYRELYQNLFDAHVVSLFYLKPIQPLFPKWYDANAQCEYHTGIARHTIVNCMAFKKLIERFIKMGIVKFDDPIGPNMVGNSLPRYSDNGVNAIVENGRRRTKMDVSERLIENKEIEFFEYTEVPKGEDVYTSEQGPTNKVHEVSHPVVIISRPRANEVGVPIAPNVIIQKSVAFPYKDSKRVPWNYDCNVTIPEGENPTGTSEKGQDEGFYTCSERRYTPNTKAEPVKGKSVVVKQEKEKTTRPESPINEPITENEAKEFLKFLKHSEYSIVE
ncbi:uncharacterized protein [Gossypium hirsutum]|uniref:Retrotransposon gag domain-containing protein n=1 Tax=Gossypium hirsutum TaxID=3635 RepID=A0A1U8MTJ6_GOSHI|nr:uncharacterized protein LOC107941131 [Gossypium hirsutum]